MFENKVLRLDSGSRFHISFEDEYMYINYSDNSAKKIQVNLDNMTITRLGIIAYCDEVIKLSLKNLYRIRDNVVIK
jgi:hypothetical protein